MRYFATLTALLFFLAACGKDDHAHDEGDGHAETAHEEHEAKHGGDMIELGDHEGHAEVKHDEENGTMALWLYDADMEPWNADAAPVLNFTVDGKPHSIKGEGEGAEWTFRDEALKGEPENARLRVAAGGTTYQAALSHHH